MSRPRIQGKKRRNPPISRSQTFVSLSWRLLVAPFLFVIAIVLVPFCIPCDISWLHRAIKRGKIYLPEPSGCGGNADECAALPCFLFTTLFEDAIVRVEKGTVVDPISINDTPALEPASWVQFLMNHQTAWWGYASLRWEWRLASMIPSDTYGASAETTMADLEFLSLLGGMKIVQHKHVFAKTNCGEQLVFLQHGILGKVASYKSGRENIQSEIDLVPPEFNPPWLYNTIEARRLSRSRTLHLQNKYEGRKVEFVDLQLPPPNHPSAADVERAIRQLARKRTKYDAQLQYSCGQAMWVFSTSGFVESSRQLQTDGAAWSKTDSFVLWGPLGSGINRCSCIQCCREWLDCQAQRSDTRKDFPEALYIRRCNPILYEERWINTIIGPQLHATCDWLLKNLSNTDHVSAVSIETRKVCHGQCTDGPCVCRSIARLTSSTNPEEEPPINEALAVVAFNTAWLGKASSEALLKASEELLFGRLENHGNSQNNEVLRWVLSYTEILLLTVRQHIGSTNIWDAPLEPYLTDFSPVVLGA